MIANVSTVAPLADAADPRRPVLPAPVEILDRGRLTARVAEHLVESLRERLSRSAHAIVAPSVGAAFAEAYALLRDHHRESLDWSRVICAQMDEYAGLGGADPRSLAYSLRRDFVAPLGISTFLRFYDDAGAPTGSLACYENRLRELGGIDCALHGVGRNGHVAFNEPDSPGPERTRLLGLAPSTRRANGVAFREGVTLGLASLCAARLSIVVLSGAHKRAAARALLCGPPGPQNPVGCLVSRANSIVYLDLDAAPACLGECREVRWR